MTGNIINSSSVDTVTIVDGKHILLDGNQINFNFQFDNITSFPTLADINKDGRQEIIFCGDNFYPVAGRFIWPGRGGNDILAVSLVKFPE